MTVDRWLPEQLNESWEVQVVIIEWFKQLLIDLGNEKLELMLGEHCVIHIVVSEYFHYVSLANDFLTYLTFTRDVRPSDEFSTHCVLIKKVAEKSSMFLQDYSDAIFLSVLFCVIKIDQ